jgi:hypothetical protein
VQIISGRHEPLSHGETLIVNGTASGRIGTAMKSLKTCALVLASAFVFSNAAFTLESVDLRRIDTAMSEWSKRRRCGI